MDTQYNLTRFLSAQQQSYLTALNEIKNGRKQSHWMWFIFPQLRGLGRSAVADYYGIQDLEEAKAFLRHPYLGCNLREICEALLALESCDARDILGMPDNRKLCSSMTLFHMADPQEPVFYAVLEKFFHGSLDYRTIDML